MGSLNIGTAPPNANGDLEKTATSPVKLFHFALDPSPAPAVIAPSMATEKRPWAWGLIGPGRFAQEFTRELVQQSRARPFAVGSRSRERAESFANEFGFEKVHDRYEALVADPGIDIVYIVTPHVFHREIAEMAIDAGKAVICEKPLTPSAEDTRQLCARARDRGVFLMEAMKTGFLPAIQQARDWIRAGEIGTPKLLKADFTFFGPDDPDDRLMNPELAGGCILDVGIYPIYLSRFLLGEVADLHATGHLAATGVEDTAAISLRHENGACASLTASFQAPEAMDAEILGSRGRIRIPRFHAAHSVELIREDGGRESFASPDSGMVAGEIVAVMDALDEGRLECPEHTHADSIRLAELMDEALRQVRNQKNGIE